MRTNQIRYKGTKKIHRNLKRTRSERVIHVQLKPNGRKQLNRKELLLWKLNESNHF